MCRNGRKPITTESAEHAGLDVQYKSNGRPDENRRLEA